MTDLRQSGRLRAAKAKKTLTPVKSVQEDDKKEAELSLLCNEELNFSSPARDENACGDMVDWLGMLKDDGTHPSSRRSSCSSANADVVEYSLSTELSEEMGKLIFGDPCVGLPQEDPAQQVADAWRHKSLRFAKEPMFPLKDEARPSLPLKAPFKFLRMRPVTPENPGRHLFSKDICPSSSSPSRAKTVTPSVTTFKTVTPSVTTSKTVTRSVTTSKTVTPSPIISTDKKPESKKRPSLTTSTDKKLESKKRRTTASSNKANARPRTIPKKKTTSMSASRPSSIQALQAPIAMRTATASTVASSLTAASARSASSRSSILSILNATHSAGGAPVPTLTQHHWGKPQELFQIEPQSSHHSDEVRLFDDGLSEEGDFPEDASFGLANARDLLEPDTSVYMCNRGPNRVDIPTEIFAIEPAQHFDNHHLPWFPVEPPTMMLPPRQQSSPWTSVGYFYGRRSSSGASVPVHEYGRQPPAVMMTAMQSASYGRKTRASLIDEEPEDPIVNCGNEFLEHPLQMTNVPPPLPPSLTDRRSSSSCYKRGSRLSRTHSNRSDDDDDFGGLLRHIFIASPNQQLHHSPNSPIDPFRLAPNGPHCFL